MTGPSECTEGISIPQDRCEIGKAAKLRGMVSAESSSEATATPVPVAVLDWYSFTRFVHVCSMRRLVFGEGKAGEDLLDKSGEETIVLVIRSVAIWDE